MRKADLAIRGSDSHSEAFLLLLFMQGGLLLLSSQGKLCEREIGGVKDLGDSGGAREKYVVR